MQGSSRCVQYTSSIGASISVASVYSSSTIQPDAMRSDTRTAAKEYLINRHGLEGAFDGTLMPFKRGDFVGVEPQCVRASVPRIWLM